MPGDGWMIRMNRMAWEAEGEKVRRYENKKG